MESNGTSRSADWLREARPRPLNGHHGRVFDLAFSSGQATSILASVSDDNTVRLWRCDSTDQSGGMSQIGSCNGHQDSVLRVKWNEEGSLIASASADTTVQLWQLANVDGTDTATCLEGKTVKTIQGHPEEVYACEFLDQSHLLTASADRLFVWDIELGTCMHEVSCMPGPPDQGQLPVRWQPGYIFSAEAQPTGTLVAAACSDGILRVWDSRPSHLQNVCSVPLYRGMTAACAWDADGNCVASVATSGDIAVVDLRRQQPQWSASAACSLRDCCYLADTQGRSHLLAAAADGSLHLSCPSKGENAQLSSWDSHAGSLLCLASSKDGNLIAMAGGSGRARHPAHINAGVHSDVAHDSQFAISLYSECSSQSTSCAS